MPQTCDNSELFSSHHQKHELKLLKADDASREDAIERRSWREEERKALKKERGQRQRAW